MNALKENKMQNSSNYNHFGQGNSWPNHNDNHNRQKELENARTKQSYKMNAEQSFDRIVGKHQQSKLNQLNWYLDMSDKGAVTRHFKMYWDRSFFVSGGFLLLITFVLSFCGIYAVLGIAVVYALWYRYSQHIFCWHYLKSYGLTQEHKSELKNSIFAGYLHWKKLLFVTVVLIVVNSIIYLYSKSFIVKYFFTSYQFHIETFMGPITCTLHASNELFAYANILAIAILMLIKLVEHWSK